MDNLSWRLDNLNTISSHMRFDRRYQRTWYSSIFFFSFVLIFFFNFSPFFYFELVLSVDSWFLSCPTSICLFFDIGFSFLNIPSFVDSNAVTISSNYKSLICPQCLPLVWGCDPCRVFFPQRNNIRLKLGLTRDIYFKNSEGINKDGLLSFQANLILIDKFWPRPV